MQPAEVRQKIAQYWKASQNESEDDSDLS